MNISNWIEALIIAALIFFDYDRSIRIETGKFFVHREKIYRCTELYQEEETIEIRSPKIEQEDNSISKDEFENITKDKAKFGI